MKKIDNINVGPAEVKKAHDELIALRLKDKEMVAQMIEKIGRSTNFKTDSMKSYIMKHLPDLDIEHIFKKEKKEDSDDPDFIPSSP